MSRGRAVLLLLASLAIVGALTLGPLPRSLFLWVRDALLPAVGLHDLSTGAVEQPANILLFIPVSLLFCFALPLMNRLAVLGLCAVGSGMVELLQSVLPGREPSLADVALNAVGAAVGILIRAVVVKTSKRSPDEERRGLSTSPNPDGCRGQSGPR